MRMVIISALAVFSCILQAQDWSSNSQALWTNKSVGIKTGVLNSPSADFLVNGRYSVFGGKTRKSNFWEPDTGIELQSTNNAFFSIYGEVTATGYSSFFFTCAPEWDYAGFTSTKNGSGKLLPILFSIDNGTGSSEKMRIATNGNVGIGTSNPQSKLAVNGTITAKEVVVTTTGWPDYVFAPDYQLMPLDQLEATIAAEGKLPGVPSAQAIETGGVSLGEMQKTLMEKVEELTLYVLQLKRENDALKMTVGQLNQSNQK